MKLLMLYPNHSSKHTVLYIRNLATSMEACGHIGYGEGRKEYIQGEPIPQAVTRLNPDAIISLEPKFIRRWLGSKDMGMHTIKLPKKAVLLSDCYPYKNQVAMTEQHLDTVGYDIIFYQTVAEGGFIAHRPEKKVYLPMSVRPSYFQPSQPVMVRDIDVSALWNVDATRVYPTRGEIQGALRNLPISLATDHVFFQDYVDTLYRTKICVCCSPIYKNIQSRYTEAAACGCLVMTDPVSDLGVQGWKDGTNMVVYNSVADLKEKVVYYINHQEEREAIALNGHDHTLQNLTDQIAITRIEKEFKDYGVASRI